MGRRPRSGLVSKGALTSNSQSLAESSSYSKGPRQKNAKPVTNSNWKNGFIGRDA